MRTLVDIEKEKLQALTLLAKDHHVSRATLIRKAIDNLLESHLKQQKQKEKDAFGILRKHPQESLALQKRLRSEWDK